MIRKTDKNIYYVQLALDYRNRAILNRCSAAVHLEATVDKMFWEKIFRHFLPDRKFDFITYSRTKDNVLATGCTVCLEYKKLNCLSKGFFICIDSDYRYLSGEKGIDVANNVFQTYTYSFENHLCYAKGIDNVIEKAGLRNDLFDFESFLESYSEVLYELFIYHLLSVSRRDGVLGKKHFRVLLNLDAVDLKENGKKMILQLKERTDAVLIDLRPNYSLAEWEETKRRYQQLGINPKNAYLYFRGHNVFEQVVLKIAREIQRVSEREIAQDLEPEEKRQFFLSRKSIESYFLEDGICFEDYAELNKIKRDIQLYFN